MQSDGNTPPLRGPHKFEHGRLLAERYRLVEKVGEGGAAEVFRAVDQRLDRTVAVKLLRPQYTSDPASRQRFVVEAKAAAGLSHPNIVDVYDFGEAPDGSMFLVMQFVQGQNLKDILQKRGRMTPGETVSIARQVCLALSPAHAKGLIHRDVKPQNIMIDTAGNARLTDFGVVKALSGPALTQSGMTFGTAAYLSPEQATGSTVSAASDIYALGCVMYEMLAGTPPFTGDNPAVVAYKQVWEQPRPLHDLVPEVPPSLEAVVMRCLNKEPSRRYAGTDELIAEFDRLSVAFTQPTQLVPLSVMAQAGAAEHAWTPAEDHSAAERSLPIPVQPAPGVGGAVAVPPVRAQTTNPGTPTVAVAPNPHPGQSMAVPARRASAPYAGRPVPPRTVNISPRRGMGWFPMALAALLVVALFGFFLSQGRDLFGVGSGGGPEASPTSAGLPSPTALLGGIEVVSPTQEATSTPAQAPTNTPAPPTGTPEPVPTDTPLPTDTPVVPTDTPERRPSETPLPTGTPEPAPSDTPVPPPTGDTPTPEPIPFPTDTPPAPPQPVGTAVIVEDAAFEGGYTRSDGLYHGRTAHWVYGQGTQFHTMTANFDVAEPPAEPATLTIAGQDSEDDARTPMRIVINDSVVIYQGPNLLPDAPDDVGPAGPGNWGSYQWRIPAGVLRSGPNSLSISNLDPSDQTNFPLFVMVDYATISW